MDLLATKFMERENYFTIANFETVAVIPSQKCSTPRRRKKSNSTNKRRFSDVQIRSLESIFYSSDSKLDSRKKVQLATELGLQPRQVAIWFQNRRARCKSKQMENDFRSLRANYDNLVSQFKSLQEEKNSLLSQLQKLSELVQGRPCEGYNSYDIENTIYETRANAKSMHLQDELEQRRVSCFSNNYKIDKRRIDNGGGLRVTTHLLEDGSNNITHAEEQACQLLNPSGSFEPSEKWCSFDSDEGGLQWPSFWG